MLTFFSSLLLMTSYEGVKQALKPDIGIWSSHLVTIVFSSLVATAGAYFALRRHERLSQRIAQENSLRRQAEEALALLSRSSRELELSKADLEREVAERVSAELALVERQRQLGILLEASQQFNSILNAVAVLQSITSSAVALTRASGGSAGLVRGGEVVLSELLRDGQSFEAFRSFPEGEAAARKVLLSKEVLIDNDPKPDLYLFAEAPDRCALHHLMAVPIMGNSGEVLGIFEVFDTERVRPFDEDDAAILQGLASAAAVALENARMLTERIEARQATAAATSLLSATIESTVDGIMAVDPHGEISACNRRFAEMWDIADELLAGGDSNSVLLSVLGQVKDSAKFFEKVTELYWLPEQESYDLVELTDGRCFERISKPQRNGEQVVGRVWTFHDVTELKRLESQLLHSQKMEAVGTLAGGIAHDFNNIMTAIIGYTSLLKTELKPPAPFHGFLERMDEASNRAVALVQNLLSYSRKDCARTSALECNTLVRNLVSFLERLIGADIEMRMDLSDAPQHVLADAGQLEQVLVNLTTNARDAMPDGGKLTLAVSSLELSEEFVKPFDIPGAGSFVRITVSDTGSGIDEATRLRIFDPFYTTKDVGKGTGLGLSISYGIAKQHGGFLSVDSQPGIGTTFSLYLPKAAQGGTKPTQVVPIKAVPRGDETLLLVEDNDSVRALISHFLTASGYRVIEAVDGADGVAKFTEFQHEISLAIIDVIMPKKNGGDACDEMRAIRGDLRSIFISGYTGDIIDRQRITEDGGNFLPKPILPAKLLGLVRDVLDKA